jgi:hypothetical protein
MDIKLLAFDSFGVRSMATWISTKDARIMIDPGAALAPRRYGLPPHLVELNRLGELGEKVAEYAEDSDLIIVTHYHYDHHNLGDLIPLEVYRGKQVYVKHPEENINPSQKFERAPLFLGKIRNLPQKLSYADENQVTIGKTIIKFSKAVPHGSNPKLGYVVEVSISDGETKLVYTSDVEGPVLEEQTQFILEEKPSIVIADGPMTYMLGYRYSLENLESALKNLKNIIMKTSVEILILDHHFMRDLNYKVAASPVYKAANSRKVKVLAAAEYAGRKIEMLEAVRPELYKKLKSKHRKK